VDAVFDRFVRSLRGDTLRNKRATAANRFRAAPEAVSASGKRPC